MIPSRKSPFFVRWFTKQVDKRIRKMFSSVHVRGLDPVAEALRTSSVLVVSNHTAWWDPMFSILLGHGLLKSDAFAMMEAKNLKRLPFLGRVGGFGVHLDDPNDRKRVLEYAAGLLDRPGRLVWIFPQGRERPRAAPIEDFKPGAALIAKRAKAARVFPVGIRYELRNRPNPEAFLSIGPPLPSVEDVEQGRQTQQDAVMRELDAIDTYLQDPDKEAGFTRLYRRPPQSKSAALAERILAFFTRYNGPKWTITD